jgi:predicted hydrolase (HD superfamily)
MGLATMETKITREQALDLLKKYNQESFHILHALTVEGVMRYFAGELGYGDEAEFWSLCGLLHDVDFEHYPVQHCIKAPELLAEIDAPAEMVHAICSHAYGLCCDVEPEHEMEKVMFAVDELTGLIGAAARMRPSKSVMDMEVSSLKKKYKDKKFAAGCSREVISQGAERLGWSLDEILEKTILAMRSCEESIAREMENIG